MLQKKYEDYLPELYKLFPDVKEESIKAIVEHGLKKIYDVIKIGSDILMKDGSASTFIGWSTVNPKEQWLRSKMKEHSKRRRIFLDQKIPWDRWHYFGMTEEENKVFVKTGESSSVHLYKILRECIIRKGIKYIYRTDLGYTLPENVVPWRESKENIKLSDCELSEEGQKILERREARNALNLKYKSKYEEDSTE